MRQRPSHSEIKFRPRQTPNWDYSNKSIYSFLGSTTFLIVLLSAPFIYLTNQNFSFFQSMAAGSNASLLTHLEREQTLYNIFSVFIIASLLFGNAWFYFKLVSAFRGQMQSFDRHLKHLIRGEWHVPLLRVRDQDDFKALVEQYGYFYKSLQAMTKSEIHLLEKMDIDQSDRSNFIIWKTLLQQKKARLGHEEIITQNNLASTSSAYWKRVG